MRSISSPQTKATAAPLPWYVAAGTPAQAAEPHALGEHEGTRDAPRGALVVVGAFGPIRGVVAAAFTSRSLASLHFGVRPLDPVSDLLVGLGLSAVALVAGLVPALPAARTHHAVALRSE
jgi:hypothetical protein